MASEHVYITHLHAQTCQPARYRHSSASTEYPLRACIVFYRLEEHTELNFIPQTRCLFDCRQQTRKSARPFLRSGATQSDSNLAWTLDKFDAWMSALGLGDEVYLTANLQS